ncbi:MAG: SMC-Scp complex subunit ScpB [Gammaproteobacteria bacterium]|jgi:segregation and condensation protein B|nr:SMC-Scp complex subunit ScpB [Gammaproteobacteria bacterium]MDB2450695.1 SMC-Scp complex subunit ScpB [Pseudomonadales bacterium]MDC6448962.1 SMC-Scp complex subunit ScpB [Pseudomonadales bacterium]
MSEIPALKQIIEGAILAADQPLSIDLMIHLFEHEPPTRAEVREALATITEECDGKGFELKEVASGYRFQVKTEYGQWVSRLWDERPPRYTRALLETLALIAYKQPITRGDIEEIRGVTVSTNIMRTLLEREWIRVVGHRDVPGKPAIYATTKSFLDYFNLSSLDELPTLSEIKDLDKVNEELDLDDEIVESRTLEIPTDEDAESVDADSESLAEVTDKVNEIEENIKNLFREEEAAEEAADEELNEIIDEAEEVLGNQEVDAEAKETEDVENTDVTVEIDSGEVSENADIDTPDETQEPEPRGQS